MKRLVSFAGFCVVLLLAANLAMANPITPTPINFQNGNGSVSGFFTLNSNGTLNTWDLISTSTNGTEYTQANDGKDLLLGGSGIFNSGQTLLFNTELANSVGGYDTHSLTINIDCGGVANCFATAADGTYFNILGGSEGYAYNGSCGGICPIVNAPVTLDVTGGAYLVVSDPAGVLNFYVTSTPVGTLFNPNGGTGNNGVPEPASLTMLGAGLLAIVLRRRAAR